MDIPIKYAREHIAGQIWHVRLKRIVGTRQPAGPRTRNILQKNIFATADHADGSMHPSSLSTRKRAEALENEAAAQNKLLLSHVYVDVPVLSGSRVATVHGMQFLRKKSSPAQAQDAATTMHGMQFLRKQSSPSSQEAAATTLVLCIPGTLSTGICFLDMVAANAASSSAAAAAASTWWAMELPGFGRSTLPFMFRDSTEALQVYHACIEAFLAKIMLFDGVLTATKSSSRLRDVVLVGHSFGAYVACHFALHSSSAMAKERIKRVVAIECVGIAPSFQHTAEGYFIAFAFKKLLRLLALPYRISSRYWAAVLSRDAVEKEQHILNLFIDLETWTKARWNQPLLMALPHQSSHPTISFFFCKQQDAASAQAQFSLLHPGRTRGWWGASFYVIEGATHMSIVHAPFAARIAQHLGA